MYFGDHISGHPEQSIDELSIDYRAYLELRGMHYSYFPRLAPMPGTVLYWKVLLGLIGNGLLPEVTYDDLDANRQVFQISGGDINIIRNSAVQQFFTRKSYKLDAIEEIRRNPDSAGFFAKMLKKVSQDYPENTILRDLTDKFPQ